MDILTRALVISSVVLFGACTNSVPAPAPAQADVLPSPERFSLRLSEIEIGAQTTMAGTFTLDSVPKTWLYVPRQCLGTRCPLLVYLHGAGLNGESSIARMRAAANRYGLLVLGPSAISPWWNGNKGAELPINQRNLETALRETLHRVAVDRHRIALIGECNGGFPAHHWGFHNLDIFSRVGTISGELWDDSTIVVSHLIPRTTSAQFYVQESIVGDEDAVRAYRRVHELRENGNTVKYVVSTHGHGGAAADFMLLGHWLADSWAHHTAAAQQLDPLPVVTPDLATKALASITKFAHEETQMRAAGRVEYTQELTVPVGEQPTVLAVDLVALAKKYPVVTMDLQAAGLTARDYTATRLALVSALLGETLHSVWQDPQGSTGVLQQNMAFVTAHPDMIDSLQSGGFFKWP